RPRPGFRAPRPAAPGPGAGSWSPRASGSASPRPPPPRGSAARRGPGPPRGRRGSASGSGRPAGGSSGLEQWVQAALAVKRMQLVGAADMLSVDEDLRKGHAAARALDHLLLLRRVVRGDDFGVVGALLVEQGLGRMAVAAAGFGVDDDV